MKELTLTISFFFAVKETQLLDQNKTSTNKIKFKDRQKVSK
jgi:hypothetical protein